MIKTDFDKRTYYSYGEIECKETRKLTLLGKYDPLFVSYRYKDWIVTPQQEKHIWRSAGHIESVVLDRARVIGTWRHTLKGSAMFVCVEPLSEIADRTKERIEVKASRIARFWGKELARVEYGKHRIQASGEAWGQYFR